MPRFEDVIKCRTIEELNDFIGKYLDENHLEGELRKKTYWALFYRWKEETREEENLKQSPKHKKEPKQGV